MPSTTEIDALVAWAESHGAVLHPSVEVYHDAATGLSFRIKPTAVTTESHPALPGDFSAAVVRLPSALSLSYLNALPDDNPSSPPCAPLAASLLHPATAAGGSPALPPHVLGRLLLVREYLAGAASFWHPYIRCLPQPSARAWRLLPPFWDDDDAELLDGTNLELGVARVRADIRRELAAIRAALLRTTADDDDQEEETNRRLADRFTPNLYRWAYAVFSSRSFRPSLVLPASRRRLIPAHVADVDDFSVLLPLLDVGNHDMTAPVRWSVLDDAYCELRCGRAHAVPGQQVFNNYGAKTNAELLLGYGFAIAPSAALHNDYVHVRKRGSGGSGGSDVERERGEEYLISARPLADASSVLARGRLPAYLPAARAAEVTPAFQHVAPEMALDIFSAIAPGVIPEDQDDGDAERRRFLAGGGGGGGADFVRTAAVVRGKLLQELERLRETDVEVGEDEAGRLTECQRLALAYREACRAVLEGALESMDADGALAAAMEAMDEDEEQGST